MTNPTILSRKGARKIEDVPPKVLDLLNSGEIETVNLTEWLAVDHRKLIETVFPEVGISDHNIQILLEQINSLKKPTAMGIIKLIGASLYGLVASNNQLKLLFNQLSTHSSDSIRCYSPFLISLDEALSFGEKLTQSKTLVADKHFGVREVVWMALRPEIDQNLDEAISFLTNWTFSEDENVRRFITESTRPRGVWCKHIDRLKENPELALPLLEPLKSDPSKYVQDSVGNWLNDASKTKPDFIEELCAKWQKESLTKATQYIIKKATRTLSKTNG